MADSRPAPALQTKRAPAWTAHTTWNAVGQRFTEQRTNPAGFWTRRNHENVEESRTREREREREFGIYDAGGGALALGAVDAGRRWVDAGGDIQRLVGSGQDADDVRPMQTVARRLQGASALSAQTCAALPNPIGSKRSPAIVGD